jgi:Protein of unknown function (DUF998)
MEQAMSANASSKISGLAARSANRRFSCGSRIASQLARAESRVSPAWRMISEYANGQYGWVLSLMFAAYGVSSFALAFAIRSQATTRRAKIGLVVLNMSGLGQASAGLFDLNQVVPHELSGMLGILGLPIAAMCISPTLAAIPQWAAARKPI